jgi:hypothetical protein
MDTHADTSCAGANWSLMELTGELCDVKPFLDSYNPIMEILVARCCTVWTDQGDSQEYLLVGDQMLWFGTLLPNSIRNGTIPESYFFIYLATFLCLVTYLCTTATFFIHTKVA